MFDTSTDIRLRTTLAILAGGEGRRMGMAKGLLQIGGQPILQRLHDRLAWPGPTLLVTAPGRENPPGHELFSSEVVDRIPGEGPLRGVMTALENSHTPLLVVMPIDMPCLSTELLRWLASALEQQEGKVVAMIQRPDPDGDRIEPLPAAFAVAGGLKLVGNALLHGHGALRDLAETPQATIVKSLNSWPPSLWVNLNRPADVERYLKVAHDEVANSR